MSEWESIERRLIGGLDSIFMMILTMDKDDRWERFVSDAKQRYETGRAEHAEADSTWEKWEVEEFDKNIREELIDCVIYAAARELRLVRTSK